jgi:hypothetical protein
MGQLARDELAAFTFDEIVALLRENRERKKELRARTAALVNSRLASLIGLEEYALRRTADAVDLEVCTRQGLLLLDEINGRSRR